MTVSFNLCRDPWVLVLDERQACHEVSLIDAFTYANRWTGLAGEMPTQQAAILRLMLAICYRALRHDHDDEDARDEWAEWWPKSFPVDRVLRYLSDHAVRFDLFSDEAPFMQVAGLRTAKGSTSGLSKLIAEIPDGSPYFTTRSGRGLDWVSPAEAARWVVHCHQYDPSGIKSGAVGDDRVKGGRGYPIGTGWAGNLGLVIAQGATLAETLLLNLVYDKPSPSADAPCWELEPQTASEDARFNVLGPVQLLTWQTRRLRLMIDDTAQVVDALVCNGDRIRPQNRHPHEYMTAWRRSANQEKKGEFGPIVYMPVTFSPERSVWRGLSGLLAGSAYKHGASNDAQRFLPAVLDWLARLHYGGHLSPDYPVRFRSVGIEYGSQSSVITGVHDDALVVRTAVLTDPSLKWAVVAAVNASHKAVLALRHLAENLDKAAGGSGEGSSERAAELAWSVLDHPFRRWVGELASDRSVQAALDGWHRIAHRELRRIGDELVRGAGQKAWKGRKVSRGSAESLVIDSSLADIWFRAELRRALDRAFSPTADASDDRNHTATKRPAMEGS